MTTTVAADEPARTKPRVSLSAKVLIGLAAGIAVGLFVGERAAALQIVADAYVNLLQMTVLPYVTLSLVGGLGSLNAGRQAARAGGRIAVILLLLWGVALVAVCLVPLMFPSVQTAAFFSTTL